MERSPSVEADSGSGAQESPAPFMRSSLPLDLILSTSCQKIHPKPLWHFVTCYYFYAVTFA